jgi:hypothetical protein
VQEQFQALA